MALPLEMTPAGARPRSRSLSPETSANSRSMRSRYSSNWNCGIHGSMGSTRLPAPGAMTWSGLGSMPAGTVSGASGPVNCQYWPETLLAIIWPPALRRSSFSRISCSMSNNSLRPSGTPGM